MVLKYFGFNEILQYLVSIQSIRDPPISIFTSVLFWQL